jgi:5-methylcytosine-specific restriction endonuclease McrA
MFIFAPMITKRGIDLNVCSYCKTTIDDYSRTVDHLFPKSRGGKLSNNNKVPCCGDCNKLKGNMDINEFNRSLSGLIFYEHTRHKESLSKLKKIKLNVESIIDERKKQHSI